jgi:hypothetical protein
VACGGGDDTATTTDASSDASGDTTTTSADTETGESSVACGEGDCQVGEVCLNFPQAPMCENKIDDEPCPEGTEDTQCGGAGLPCCCGPTPPTLTECTVPSGCGEMVDCACLSEVCIPSCSATGTDGVFFCEEGPVP